MLVYKVFIYEPMSIYLLLEIKKIKNNLQVRRWQVWDQKVSKDDERPKFQKNSKKQVQFLKGEDGEPWVWVMGEHPDDKSIDTILAEEARQRVFAQAREEAHQLRKSVEKELTQLIDYKPLDSLEQVNNI
ncbi:SH2 domain-containing protein 4A-like [Galleria mellonella]|uniref:SH2 domain-containing protein 4A-like n=1 Tax=Galleria mellonella TaxID=7137 RepID=A0ABM3MHK4_GALME|nr:SH2 domain-containing protein 4A-like [Galleria mellonella]